MMTNVTATVAAAFDWILRQQYVDKYIRNDFRLISMTTRCRNDCVHLLLMFFCSTCLRRWHYRKTVWLRGQRSKNYTLYNRTGCGRKHATKTELGKRLHYLLSHWTKRAIKSLKDLIWCVLCFVHCGPFVCPLYSSVQYDQCCSSRGKCLSSRILEDQFTSPYPCSCPRTSSPCPFENFQGIRILQTDRYAWSCDCDIHKFCYRHRAWGYDEECLTYESDLLIYVSK